jgi:hypothetical protein
MTTKAEHNRRMLEPDPQPDDGATLVRLLNRYISAAFENEREFLDKFLIEEQAEWSHEIELIECYMASGLTRIRYKLPTGYRADGVIATPSFIDWVDGRTEE